MSNRNVFLAGILVLIIALPQIVFAGFDDYFHSKTLRFDYLHTGTHETGTEYADQVR